MPSPTSVTVDRGSPLAERSSAGMSQTPACGHFPLAWVQQGLPFFVLLPPQIPTRTLKGIAAVLWQPNCPTLLGLAADSVRCHPLPTAELLKTG